MNDEFERMWKEAVMTQPLPNHDLILTFARTDGGNNWNMSKWTAFRPRLEPSPSRQVYTVTATPACSRRRRRRRWIRIPAEGSLIGSTDVTVTSNGMRQILMHFNWSVDAGSSMWCWVNTTSLRLTRYSWIRIGWQWIQFQLANMSRSS